MSILLMTQAFSLRIENCTAKLILLKLADNANDNGYCFPSIDYIAQQCSVHPRTVKRQIKNLVELGYLEVKPRFNNNKQRSNEYLLHIASPIKSGGDISPPHKDPVEPITSNTDQIRGDTRSPVGVTEDHPESIDLSNRVERDQVISSSSAEHISNQFARLWEEWPNSKNKIRSVSAFKTFCRGKSPDSINLLVDGLIIDTRGRLKALQLGFSNMMLSTYLNNERYKDDITGEQIETDEAEQANKKKGNDLLKEYGYK